MVSIAHGPESKTEWHTEQTMDGGERCRQRNPLRRWQTGYLLYRTSSAIGRHHLPLPCCTVGRCRRAEIASGVGEIIGQLNFKLIYCLFGVNYFFSIFIFYAWFGMLSQGIGESFILSEDEPLTPNIDGVMAL